MVVARGRRRGTRLVQWFSLGHPVRVAEFERLVLARAATAGADTRAPSRRRWLRSGAEAGLPPFTDRSN